MKKVLVILFVALLATPTFAQKVKIKKKTVYVDKVAFLTWENSFMSFESCPITLASGTIPVMSHKGYQYGNRCFVHFKFLDFDGDMWISFERKRFFKLLYKSGIINDDGTIDEEKARRFIRTYGEEVPTFITIDRQ